jgi:NAD(P)-dependent dehydrogenase (short-subunit alcohol dehydrogenase family)
VSSTAHKTGSINFDDLQSKRSYNPWMAYSQSKIANLLFTYELQKRLHRANAKTIAVAAQPGYARTELMRHSEGNPILAKLSSWLRPIASQSAEEGALPEIRAAVDPSVKGSDYFSPANFFELKGPPVLTESNKRSHDKNVQRQLWKVSEELTGIKYAI